MYTDRYVHVPMGEAGGLTGLLNYNNNDPPDLRSSWLPATATFGNMVSEGMGFLLQLVRLL